MSFNGLVRLVALASLVFVSFGANAFVPAPGLWSFVSESTQNLPGRGITIEVENNIFILTYYGYRTDGSAVFYTAAGPMSGNSFSAALSEFTNGTPVGQSYRPAALAGSSPGSVFISFSSGLNGTITLPGESAKAIAKYGFGYGNTPAGLMGTYFLGYTTTSGSTFTDTYRLSRLTGLNTSTGNGVVTDSIAKFGCENQISGVLLGAIICVETGSTGYEDTYVFKMSGDRGTGVAKWALITSYSPLQVIRTVTQSGTMTGVNDGNLSSVVTASAVKDSNVGAAVLEDKMQSQAFNALKDREPLGTFRGGQLSAEEQEALQQWTLESSMFLGK